MRECNAAHFLQDRFCGTTFLSGTFGVSQISLDFSVVFGGVVIDFIASAADFGDSRIRRLLGL